MGDQQVVLTHN